MSEDEEDNLSALAALLSDDEEQDQVYDSLEEHGEHDEPDAGSAPEEVVNDPDLEDAKAAELEDLRRQVELLKGQLSQQAQSTSLKEQVLAKRQRIEAQGSQLLRNKVAPPLVFPSERAVASGVIRKASDFGSVSSPQPAAAKRQRIEAPSEFLTTPNPPTEGAAGSQVDEFTEKYSRVKLKPGRRVSVYDLDEKLKQARIVTLAGVAAAASVQGDWVCFGVIANKSEPKPTSKGGHFVILKLTDMRLGGMTMVSVFLFGKAFEAYWREKEGLLVCLANAKMLPQTDQKKGLALSISSAQQLLIIGEAADFDYCAAYQKNTMVRCTNVVCKAGSFCAYHVKAQYMKMAANRVDVNRTMDRSFSQALNAGMPKNLSTGTYKIGHTLEDANLLAAPKPVKHRIPKSSRFTCKELLDLHNKTSQSYRLQMGIQDKATASQLAKEQPVGLKGLKAAPSPALPDRKMSGYDYMLQKQASQAFHEAKQMQKLQQALAEAGGTPTEVASKMPASTTPHALPAPATSSATSALSSTSSARAPKPAPSQSPAKAKTPLSSPTAKGPPKASPTPSKPAVSASPAKTSPQKAANPPSSPRGQPSPSKSSATAESKSPKKPISLALMQNVPLAPTSVNIKNPSPLNSSLAPPQDPTQSTKKSTCPTATPFSSTLQPNDPVAPAPTPRGPPQQMVASEDKQALKSTTAPSLPTGKGDTLIIFPTKEEMTSPAPTVRDAPTPRTNPITKVVQSPAPAAKLVIKPDATKPTSPTKPASSGPIKAPINSAKPMNPIKSLALSNPNLAARPKAPPGVYTRQPLGIQTRPKAGKPLETQTRAEYLERQQQASALLAEAKKLEEQARQLQALGGAFPTPNPNCTKSGPEVLPPKRTEEPAGAVYTLEDALKSPEDTLEAACRRGQSREAEPPKPKVVKTEAVRDLKKKMTEVFGGVDINSSEGKRLLEARSIHAHLADQTERLRRQELFDVMEKKEEMLEQMAATKFIMTPAFECQKCKHVTPCYPPVCQTKGHPVKKIEAKKRFFQCDHCKQKTTTLNLRLPNEVCSHCRKKDWVRTGMMTLTAEKPVSEQLLVRGEEQGFSLRE